MRSTGDSRTLFGSPTWQEEFKVFINSQLMKGRAASFSGESPVPVLGAAVGSEGCGWDFPLPPGKCMLVAQLCLTLRSYGCHLPVSSIYGESPGRKTGVGCHSLLQGIFPTQGSNPCLLHRRQIFFLPSEQPGKLLRHHGVKGAQLCPGLPLPWPRTPSSLLSTQLLHSQ